MARLLLILLVAVMLLGCVGQATAQTPGQPANPGQAPATQPAQPGGEATQRGSTLDYVIAFAGAALVLVVVCYPSRRY